MVHHQEAALQKIIMQAFSLFVGERPRLYVDGVDPGIVEEMVALKIGHVQRRRRVDARQTPQGNQTIVIGLGIVLRPTAAIAAKPAAIGGIVLEPNAI
jgi:hypothetical protein